MIRQLAINPVTADEDGDQLDLIEEVAKLHDVPAAEVAAIAAQARQADARDAADRAAQAQALVERTAAPAQATHCAGTEALTDAQALVALAGTPDAEWYAQGKWYGRKMCATCGGAVMENVSGKLRRHKPGSNRA